MEDESQYQRNNNTQDLSTNLSTCSVSTGGSSSGEGTTLNNVSKFSATTMSTFVMEEHIDLRHELLRRLHNMQMMDGIFVSAWAWDVLYHLDCASNDLWTLLVYAGCLLKRGGVFSCTKYTLQHQRQLTLAALSIAVKMIHDGQYRLLFCHAEMELCKLLNWVLIVSPEEYEIASWRWM